MIVDAVTEGVERFDMKRKTCLATDWSNRLLLDAEVLFM